MTKRVFVTNKQWDGCARRLAKKYSNDWESLLLMDIMGRVRPYVVELLPNQDGMIVLVGWEQAMERAASGSAELVLIRVLPGSGKTTIAKSEYPCHVLIEADDWRMTKDGYSFDCTENKRANDWCFLEAERQLRLGNDVVVTGTYTTRIGVSGYAQLAKKYGANFVVIEAIGEYENVHCVPNDVIERMRDSWEVWDE